MNTISSLSAFFQAQAPKASSSIDVSIWKWVIIVGVTAVIIFYGIKRVSDIVVKRKTDMMIRSVGDNGENGEKTDGE